VTPWEVIREEIVDITSHMRSPIHVQIIHAEFPKVRKIITCQTTKVILKVIKGHR